MEIMLPRRVLSINLLLVLTLAGCDRLSGRGDAADEGRLIACAVGAQSVWGRDCPVERDRDLLTIRHPDGGFRRFRIVHDGHGVVPADGAEEASMKIAGHGEIELSVGQDRYRIPVRFAEGNR